jgi:multiple sugar transport system permease protein
VISAKAIRNVTIVERTRRARKGFVPYWFILPSLIVLGVFIAYPVGYSFWLSFHDYQWNMPAFGRPWVGLLNYTDIPNDRDLMASIRWTATFAAFSVPIGFVLGLVLALLLNSPLLGRARGFLRGVFLIPMMLAGVVAGFMWRMLFDPEFGPVNHLLGLVGVGPVSWFGDTMAARTAVIVTELWLTTPFVMLVLLAGLQGIPEELHEAARIDGASAVQIFAHVTLPLLRSAIAIVLIIRTMDALRAFDQIFVLTGGGPGMSTTTVMYFDYLYAFNFYQMGRASAVSFAVLVVIALITAGYLAVLRRSERD